MNPAHCFSHQTAAELYGLPLPAYVTTDDLHVAAPAPLRAPESVGVSGHRISSSTWQTRDLVLRDEPLAELLSFSVAAPALVWVQLASVLDVEDLVALGDAIVTPLPRAGLLDDPVLASVADLLATADAHRGRRGAEAMWRAVRGIRPGPRSRPESLLRLMVLRAGLPEPQLNLDVYGSSGEWIAEGDLCWPEYRVVVEYEGDYHRREVSKLRSDVTRGERYADAG